MRKIIVLSAVVSLLLIACTQNSHEKKETTPLVAGEVLYNKVKKFVSIGEYRTGTSADSITAEWLRALYPTKTISSVDHFISRQFGHLFNGYTQLINKANNRTGGLFETPFRRIEVDNDAYFSQMIWYIHSNPQKHGFVSDFRDYPNSSYHSHLASAPTKLKRNKVLGWFGDKSNYLHFHSQQQDENSIRNLMIKFD